MAGKKKPISSEQLEQAKQYAFNGHQNCTIETLMGWSNAFIDKRPDLSMLMTLKRAERKEWLRSTLDGQAKTNIIGTIFLSKQSDHMGGLGFADKQELTLQGGETPLVVVIGRSGGEKDV